MLNLESGGPHFLGIGAPRCGTTWLYRTLLSHPAVWLPPIKELHYFDSIDDSIREHFQVHRRNYRLTRYLSRRGRHYLAAPLAPFSTSVRRRVRLDLPWDLRYFLGSGDLDWYLDLFARPSAKGLLTGEITPAYIMLGEATISMVRQKVPARKLIVMLRNPVEAAWSAVSKDVRDGELALDVGHHDQVVAALARPELRRRYAYGDNLEKWSKFYRRNEIFVGYFDDLVNGPADLISRICGFLGIADVYQGGDRSLRQRINSASSVLGKLTPGLRTHLIDVFVPQMRKLAELLPDHPQPRAWLDEARSHSS